MTDHPLAHPYREASPRLDHHTFDAVADDHGAFWGCDDPSCVHVLLDACDALRGASKKANQT